MQKQVLHNLFYLHSSWEGVSQYQEVQKVETVLTADWKLTLDRQEKSVALIFLVWWRPFIF